MAVPNDRTNLAMWPFLVGNGIPKRLMRRQGAVTVSARREGAHLQRRLHASRLTCALAR